MNLVKVSAKTKVPQGAGIDGFMRTIKEILQLRRLQGMRVNATGVVEYEYYAPEDLVDKPAVEIDYSDVSPAYVIQHVALMREVSYAFGTNAAEVICRMLEEVQRDDLVPFAFVVGAKSLLHDWHAKTSCPITSSGFYGFPLIVEPSLPDDILVLCAAYERSSTFVDTLKTYKIALVM